LLRSSAAWRTLHDAFPGVQLHLVFFTRDPGAASEELIAHHHLLSSFHVFPKWPTTFAQWRRASRWLLSIVRSTAADTIIDFEPNGTRTSMLVWLARRRLGVRTFGIAEVPGRQMFYQRAAPGRRAYARRHGLAWPLNYSERDFVALAALGLERDGRAIELRETPKAAAYRETLAARFGLDGDVPRVGLNVGCGTPGAEDKQPNVALLQTFLDWLQREHSCDVLLTGAPFERDINEVVIRGCRPPPGRRLVNTAGTTHLLELPGLIRACSQFVSSDSGPFHMAVAMRVPTLGLFNRPNPVHEHHHPWVRCIVAPGLQELPRLQTAAQELRAAFPWKEAVALR
jgi:ADP-heptose:LPS heptosyltransferase